MDAVRIILSGSNTCVTYEKLIVSLSTGEHSPPSAMSVSSDTDSFAMFGTVIGSMVSNLCKLPHTLFPPYD